MPALLAALVLAGALALPAGAAAGTTPFTGLTGGGGSTSSGQTTTTATATTAPPVKIPSAAPSGSSLPTYAYILIAAFVVVVFGTIAYLIRRDAHLHAPRHAVRDIDRGRGTVAPQTERRKRSRARAKAARKARRRK